MSDQLNFLNDLLNKTKKAGADQADVILSEQQSTRVVCRGGKLESSGSADSASVSLRVFAGRKMATLSSSDLSPDALSEMIEQTITIARNAPESAHAGLVEPEHLADPDATALDLYDDKQVDADTLFDTAAEMEQAALAVDGVEQSTGAGATAGEGITAICTSNGFAGLSRRSSFGLSCGTVASQNASKEMASEFSSAVFREDLDDPSAVGREAGERAAAKLGSGAIETGTMPVVYAPYIANSILRFFVSLISGTTVARGTSFLKDSLDQAVFADAITIIEDSAMPRGHASRSFDGEGVASTSKPLIEAGQLTGFLHNLESASQLGMELTGNGGPLGRGVSAANVYMEAGTASPDELMADIPSGFYVTSLLGHGPSPVTGDYSHGAAGFVIENGKISRPIKGATIAGNLKAMYRDLSAANDLEFRGQFNAPTVRIDGMTVAGS